jgi:hypothetical protein
MKKEFGVIAQLGERLHGMQEVRGSIPRSSTTICSKRQRAARTCCLMKKEFGVIAQLGERLHGMQEVRGSIPRSSTNFLLQESQRPPHRGGLFAICLLPARPFPT